MATDELSAFAGAWDIIEDPDESDFTENNLCPYDNCAHALRIPREGWYICDNCRRVLYAEESSGDDEVIIFELFTPTEYGEIPSITEFPVAEDIEEFWEEEENEDLEE